MSAEDTNRLLLPMYNALRSDYDLLKSEKDRLTDLVWELQRDKSRLDWLDNAFPTQQLMDAIERSSNCRVIIDAAMEQSK